MYCRIFSVAIGALLASVSTDLVSSSFAQTSQQNSDRLKKLLEEKFIPPPAPTQKPPTVDRKDLHWIAPKPNPQPGKQGRLAPARDPLVEFVANDNIRHYFTRVADNRNGGLRFVGMDVVELKLPNGSSSPQLTPSTGKLQFAQAPVAKRNSYIIQLKPNATAQQISALLAKYNLRVTGGQASYGLLRVERNVTAASSTEAEKLSDILNQQIIRDLRREPIISGASIDSTIKSRTVPKSSNTSVGKDGAVYTWSWKNSPPIALTTAGMAASVPTPQLDGNWGLKAIRMPPVWTILQRYRDTNPTLTRPKLAIIDSGFAKHEDLDVNLVDSPNQASTSAVASSLVGNCGNAHGNHVAGIAGAVHGNGIGLDGVIPQAKIDAVPWSDILVLNEDPGATREDTRTTLMSEALFAVMSYVEVETSRQNDLRVINVSLGYNFGARPVIEGDPEKIGGMKDTIETDANWVAQMAQKHKNILFVTAAGNDSAGRAAPYDAKWSSPIVWAATQLPPSRRPKNILIVEANDRSGQRPDFSNIGGHIAAPGVDVLSTLWPGDNAYGPCPGTSMAAPHVAGLAALLFELDPGKKAADIADIIKASAIKPAVVPGGPPRVPGAPRLDALEAVLKLSPDNLVRLADLNRDGKVDIEDMKIFAKHLAAIANNRDTGGVFTEDLNGDGVVDANECNWPLIDLNGSGTASLSLADAKLVQGLYRTDLDVLALAWTDKTKDFKAAMKETGLDVLLQSAETAPMAVASRGCR